MESLSKKFSTYQIVLRKLSSAVASGKSETIEILAIALEEENLSAYASLVRMFRSAQLRDLESAQIHAETIPISELTSNPWLYYSTNYCLYWAGGLTAIRAHLRLATDGLLARLSPRQSNEIRHLQSFQRMMEGASTRRFRSQICEIPFLKKHQLLLVEIAINNAKPCSFILDTGAPTTVLSIDLARKINLTRDETTWKAVVDGGGHELNMYPAVARNFRLDGITLSNLPIHLASLSDGLGADGILSPQDCFRGMCVEIDSRASVLRVAHPTYLETWKDACSSGFLSQDLLWSGGVPTIQTFVNSSQEAQFVIDTGAGANILCKDFASKLSFQVSPKDAFSTTTAAAETTIYPGGQISILTGGSLSEHMDFLIKTCFSDSEVLIPQVIHGYLGAPWFAGRRVLFAPSTNKLLWT